MRHATTDERTDTGVAHTYTVYYPSGRVFTVTGVLAILCLSKPMGLITLIRRPTDDVALDPRAVVTRDGLIIVDPRRKNPTGLAPWVRTWLRENPHWPRIVTEQESVA